MDELKPKKGRGSGKPFAKGTDDARRWKGGQINKKAVRTAVEAREFIVEMMNAPKGYVLPDDATAMQHMIWTQIQSALDGDLRPFEALFDRVFGKAIQAVDLTSSDGTMAPQAIMFVPYSNTDVSPNTDNP